MTSHLTACSCGYLDHCAQTPVQFIHHLLESAYECTMYTVPSRQTKTYQNPRDMCQSHKSAPSHERSKDLNLIVSWAHISLIPQTASQLVQLFLHCSLSWLTDTQTMTSVAKICNIVCMWCGLQLFLNYKLFNSQCSNTTCNNNTLFNRPFPGLPGWAGTRWVNQSGFYWSKRQWVAVASAGR